MGNLGCPLCGGQHRRKTRPIGVIQCGECDQVVCTKHSRWIDDAWQCTRCIRAAAKLANRGG